MLLRSWLSDWRQRLIPLCGMVHTARPFRRRLAPISPHAEALEQRCVLTTIDLANLGAGGITVFGVDEGDLSGYSVSGVGDMNGDGFDDFLIGAERGDALDDLKYGAGESYLIFGGASLSATIDLANLGSGGVTIFGADVTDHSGYSVSGAGDVNGDGFDDLLIGANLSDGPSNAEESAGESYLIFGKASLPATIDLANLGAAGTVIFGADASDQSGCSVAGAGDVNGDGFDDIIIGAFASDGTGNSENYAGESYLIFGKASLPASIDLGNLGTAGTTIFGADAGDNAGRSVGSAGDMNGDGFGDVVIGAISAAAAGNAKVTAGESYVIFGKATLPATIDLASLGAAGVAISGADATDFSGYSVSTAGDVNGDGFDDLLIGAPRTDGAGEAESNSGETYLIFGKASLPTTIDLGNLGAAGITLFGVDGVDYSGRAVSGAGDVNGDGFDDLLIGALLADGAGNAQSYAGEAYLIFGGTSLPATVDLENLGAAGISFFGLDANDNTGFSLSSAGDVNGDGFDDILIGARASDGAGNALPSAGESYLIYGSDFTGAVTLPGTSTGETLTGSGAIDVMNGADGNDTLVGNGGADVIYGGRGDDVIAISDLNFQRLNGGNGSDTLRLDDSGLILNLTTLADNRLTNFEVLDIRGSGVNTLILNVREALNLTSNSNPAHTSNTLRIVRDNNDTVIIGAGWTETGAVTIDTQVFTVLTQGAATLQISTDLAIGGPAVTWTKKQTPVKVLPQILVGAGANLPEGILTISVNAVGKKKSTDLFVFPSTSSLGSNAVPQFANGRVTLSFELGPNVTKDTLQTFLRGITFATKGKGLNLPTRTLDVTLTDADNEVSTVRQTINVRKKP